MAARTFSNAYAAMLSLIAVAMIGILAMLFALALMQLDPKGERRRAAASQPDARSSVEKRWATVLALLPSVVLWAMLSNIILGYGRAHALVELSAGTVALVVLVTYATLAWRGALAPARFLRGTWVLTAFIVACVMVSGIAEAHRTSDNDHELAAAQPSTLALRWVRRCGIAASSDVWTDYELRQSMDRFPSNGSES